MLSHSVQNAVCLWHICKFTIMLCWFSAFLIIWRWYVIPLTQDSSSCVNTHQEEEEAEAKANDSTWTIVFWLRAGNITLTVAEQDCPHWSLCVRHSTLLQPLWKHRPVLDWNVSLHPVNQPNCTCKGTQCAIKRSLQGFIQISELQTPYSVKLN